MDDLANILTDFHPTTGRIAPFEPLSQAQLPIARELSNADSLRLDELLTAGSLTTAVVDAALGSIYSLPEGHLPLVGAANAQAAQTAAKLQGRGPQETVAVRIAQGLQARTVDQQRPGYVPLPSAFGLPAIQVGQASATPQQLSQAVACACDGERCPSHFMVAAQPPQQTGQPQPPHLASAGPGSDAGKQTSSDSHASSSSSKTDASAGAARDGSTGESAPLGDEAGGDGAATDGSRPSGNMPSGSEDGGAAGSVPHPPEVRPLREEEQRDVDEFTKKAWEANYEKGDAAQLEFTGPTVGARTTGRLMAAATAQLMRRGLAAAQNPVFTGLSSTIRTAMERHMPPKKDEPQLEGDKKIEFLEEALRSVAHQLAQQLATRGVDPSKIVQDITKSMNIEGARGPTAADGAGGRMAAAPSTPGASTPPMQFQQMLMEAAGLCPDQCAAGAGFDMAFGPSGLAAAAVAAAAAEGAVANANNGAAHINGSISPADGVGSSGGGGVTMELLHQAFQAFASEHDAGGASGGGAAAGGDGGGENPVGAGTGDAAMVDFQQSTATTMTAAAPGGGGMPNLHLPPPVMAALAPYQRTTGSVTMLDAWIDDTDPPQQQLPVAAAAAGANGNSAAATTVGEAPALGQQTQPQHSSQPQPQFPSLSSNVWGGKAMPQPPRPPSSPPSAAQQQGGPITAPAAAGGRDALVSVFAAPSCISPPSEPSDRRPGSPRPGASSPYRLSNAMSILRQASAGLGGAYIDTFMSSELSFLDPGDLALDGRLPSIADKFLMSIDSALPPVPSFMPPVAQPHQQQEQQEPGQQQAGAPLARGGAEAGMAAAGASASTGAARGADNNNNLSTHQQQQQHSGSRGQGGSVSAPPTAAAQGVVPDGGKPHGSGDLLQPLPPMPGCSAAGGSSKSPRLLAPPTGAAAAAVHLCGSDGAAAAAAAGGLMNDPRLAMYDMEAMMRNQTSAPAALMSNHASNAAMSGAASMHNANAGCGGGGGGAAQGGPASAFRTSFAMASAQYGSGAAADGTAVYDAAARIMPTSLPAGGSENGLLCRSVPNMTHPMGPLVSGKGLYHIPNHHHQSSHLSMAGVGGLTDMPSAPAVWGSIDTYGMYGSPGCGGAFGGGGGLTEHDQMASAPVNLMSGMGGHHHLTDSGMITDLAGGFPMRARSLHEVVGCGGMVVGTDPMGHPSQFQQQQIRIHHTVRHHPYQGQMPQMAQMQQTFGSHQFQQPFAHVVPQSPSAPSMAVPSPGQVSGSRRGRQELEFVNVCDPGVDPTGQNKVRGLSDPQLFFQGPHMNHGSEEPLHPQQFAPQQFYPGGGTMLMPQSFEGISPVSAVGMSMSSSPFSPDSTGPRIDDGNANNMHMSRMSAGGFHPPAALVISESPGAGAAATAASGRGGRSAGSSATNGHAAAGRSPRAAAASVSTPRSPRTAATPRGRAKSSASPLGPASTGVSLPNPLSMAAAIEELISGEAAAAVAASQVGGAAGGVLTESMAAAAVSAGPSAAAVAAAVAAGLVGTDDGAATAAAGAGDGGSSLRRSRRENRGNKLSGSGAGGGRKGGRNRGGDDDDEDYATDVDEDDGLTSDDEDDGPGGGGGAGGRGGGGASGDPDADSYVDEDSVLVVRAVRDGVRREITKSALRKVYHLPINEAAAALNIGVTVLKKYCRKFRVPRWPYRKLQSMAKLIESFQRYKRNALQSADLEGAERCEVVIQSLLKFREEVYDNPDKDIDEGVKKLRQANFKIEYRQRQGQSQAPPLTTLGTTSAGEAPPSGAPAVSGDLGRDFETLSVDGGVSGEVAAAVNGSSGAAS